MITLDQLKAFPAGEVFATGVLPNSPEGIYMTNTDVGRDLRWIAKKGWGHDDWAVYCHWEHHDVEWIKEQGDKVTSKENIQKCVPCTDEVYSLYRF